MKELILPIFCTFILLGCTTGKKHISMEENISQRMPSNLESVLSRQDLSTMKPVQLLRYLQKSCCQGILIEPSDVSFWRDSDLSELQAYTEDKTPSAPVVSLNSSISCQSSEYTSTVGREAKHLIEAIKRGKYPLSNCSTYDLHINGD